MRSNSLRQQVNNICEFIPPRASSSLTLCLSLSIFLLPFSLYLFHSLLPYSSPLISLPDLLLSPSSLSLSLLLFSLYCSEFPPFSFSLHSFISLFFFCLYLFSLSTPSFSLSFSLPPPIGIIPLPSPSSLFRFISLFPFSLYISLSSSSLSPFSFFLSIFFSLPPPPALSSLCKP